MCTLWCGSPLQASGYAEAGPDTAAYGDTPVEDDQPMYVNAKQYNRILKRRQARAKLENEMRISKERKVRLSNVDEANGVILAAILT